jgi:hypothetical protein
VFGNFCKKSFESIHNDRQAIYNWYLLSFFFRIVLLIIKQAVLFCYWFDGVRCKFISDEGCQLLIRILTEKKLLEYELLFGTLEKTREEENKPWWPYFVCIWKMTINRIINELIFVFFLCLRFLERRKKVRDLLVYQWEKIVVSLRESCCHTSFVTWFH